MIANGSGLVRLPGGHGGWILDSTDTNCLLIINMFLTADNKPSTLKFEKPTTCTLTTLEEMLEEYRSVAEKINIPKGVIDEMILSTKQSIKERFHL